MSIEEKLEELQKDIAYMRVDVLAIREYVVDISYQLQKMQQPKTCKWEYLYASGGFKSYKLECKTGQGCNVQEVTPFCPFCGGKIEIVEVQK